MSEEINEVLDEKSLQVLSNEKEAARPDNGGWLDQIQQKVVSRKLLVFGAATVLFIWAGLEADIWGMIAMCYIGGQSAIDFAKVWKG
mgnify:CR=1 FL=1